MNIGLAVAGGGALGAWLRYQVSGWVHRSVWSGGLSDRFPLGTFVVNLSGCFLLGLLAGLFYERSSVTPGLRAFLLIGVLGGYTTFSTFAMESLDLLRYGSWGLALTNVVASPTLGLLGAYLGSTAARAVPL